MTVMTVMTVMIEMIEMIEMTELIEMTRRQTARDGQPGAAKDRSVPTGDGAADVRFRRSDGCAGTVTLACGPVLA
jgi:hypothetical protein